MRRWLLRRIIRFAWLEFDALMRLTELLGGQMSAFDIQLEEAKQRSFEAEQRLEEVRRLKERK